MVAFRGLSGRWLFGGVLACTLLSGSLLLATPRMPGAARLIARLAGMAHSFEASTLVVNVTDDNSFANDGRTTLREAIAYANSRYGDDTITFDPAVFTSDQTITLAGTELAVNSNVTIQGPTASHVTISGNSASRVFNIASGSLNLLNLTVSYGKTTGNGGDILNNGKLTATDSTISCGLAANGGAIYSTGATTLTRCTFMSSVVTGEGGVFDGGGSLTTNNCIFDGNQAVTSGGAITISTGASSVSLNNSIFRNNTLSGASSIGGAVAGMSSSASFNVNNCTFNSNSGRGGGAIALNAGTLVASNCTFYSNHAVAGGAANSFLQGSISLINSTLNNNTASTQGGGLYTSATAKINNTLIAGNVCNGSPDIYGTIVSQGYNLIGDKTGGTLNAATGDLAGNTANPIQPNLGTLQYNGAFTPTVALLSSSPAIDAGNSGLSGLATDQRGLSRPHDTSAPNASGGDGGDIGAYEYSNGALPNTAPAMVSSAPSTVRVNQTITVTLNATDAENDSLSFTTTSPPLNASARFFDGPDTSRPITTGAVRLQDPLHRITIIGDSPGTTGLGVTASDGNLSSGLGGINVLVKEAGSLVVNTTSVSSTESDGQTSLQEAINYAVSNPGDDTITFDSAVFNTDQTISLSNSIGINTNVTIIGPTNSHLTISGNNATRCLSIGGATVNLSNLTIANGYTTDSGGGIATLGVVTLNRCTLSNNHANSGYGGALAIANAGSVTLNNCTLSGNSAMSGGALNNAATTMTLNSCTLSGNTATSSGGGVLTPLNGTLNINNTLVAGNTAASGSDVSGPVVSGGYNLIGKKDNSGSWIASDKTGTIASPLDPLLGTLQNNGGPTYTMALLDGSPAIDAGNSAVSSLTTDQRGKLRPADTGVANAAGGNGSDIGAYELFTGSQSSSSFVVTKTADTDDGACTYNDCSLREAIAAANDHTGADTITFDPNVFSSSRVILLSGSGSVGTPLHPNAGSDSNPDLSIIGPSNSSLTITGNGPIKTFIIESGIVTLTNLTISGGKGDNGGGIYLPSGTLALNNCTLSGNSAASGGALYVGGDATLNNCTISGNSATVNGAGVANTGNLTLNHCTISDNTNSGSSPDGLGGGIYNTGTLALSNTLIAGNAARLGIDVYGAANSGGYNLVGKKDDSSGWTALDLTGTVAAPLNASLDTLKANGGPTKTMALLVGSPAIDKGNNSVSGLTTDQRGLPRVVDFGTFANAATGDGSDIGAYELQGALPSQSGSPAFVVNSVAEDNDGTCGPIGSGNDCTLREAIAAANIKTGDDTITFDLTVFGTDQTIKLTSGELFVDSNIVINGPANNHLMVSGNFVSRVFNINSGTVTLSHLTVANGRHASVGAGIYNRSGTLTLNECRISNNLVTNNPGYGAGLFNNGVVVLNNCAVDSNQCGYSGGGLGNGANAEMTMTLNNCTLFGNTATAQGGGIYNSGGPLTLRNCTLISNGSASGGGLLVYGGGSAASITNTLMAFNTTISTTDVSGTFNSGGYNLIRRGDGSSGWVASDQIGTTSSPIDPKIELNSSSQPAFNDNGGYTPTVALLVGSPALDKGNSAVGGLTTDQRGLPRPVDFNTCANAADGGDIGAYEVQGTGTGQSGTPSFVVNSVADDDDGSCGSLSDGDDCTLREAIAAAKIKVGDDTITFAPTVFGTDQTITLTTGPLNIDSNITINGPIASKLTLSGNHAYRVFNISGGTTTLVTLTNMSIRDGSLGTGSGGGIASTGTLTVQNVNFGGNVVNGSGSGGGIYSTGRLTVSNSSFNNNSAMYGGGIFSNTATNRSAPCTILNSTLTANTASSNGGAICNANGLTVIQNCTITANTAAVNSGSGVASKGGTTTFTEVDNSIIAGNTGTDVDLVVSTSSNSFTSKNYNLVGSGNAIAAFNQSGDHINIANPLLGSLTGNGGNTLCMAPLAGSPALDQGNRVISGLTTDQRGQARPSDGGAPNAAGGDGSDIGAVEVPAPVLDLNGMTPGRNQSVTFTEDGGAISLSDIAATLADADSTQLTGATIKLDVTPDESAEILAATTDGTSLTANYDGPTRTLTLSGTDTVAHYLQVLKTVTYNNTDQDPDATNRVATFIVSDGVTTNLPATTTIEVTPVNDAPSFTAGDDVTVNEDSGAYAQPWATDISNIETGQTLCFLVSNTNNALFAVQPAIDNVGKLTFTPASNASGSATVTVKLKDNGDTANGGQDTSAPVTFTITVNSSNDAPSFTAGDNVTVNEDSGAYVQNWAMDIADTEGSQNLTFLVSNTNIALFSLQPTLDSTGKLNFTPASDANGTSTITVQLQDDGGTANGGQNASVPVTFTITVVPINDAPSFTKGSDVSVDEDAGAQSVANWAKSIAAGPANEVGQTLEFVVSNSNTSLFAVQPVIASDGTLTFTPAANANGTSTVTVQLQDNGGTANGGHDTSSSVTFTIAVGSLNDVPTAVDDSASTNEDTPVNIDVTVNDSDADGDTLTVTDATTSAQTHGVLSINQNGTVRFVPEANFNGTARFSYTISDGSLSATANVTVTVMPVNDAPAAANQSVATGEDTAKAITLSASDIDSAGLSYAIVTPPIHGTLSGALPNMTYIPVANYHGNDSFTFKANDGALDSNVATVSITISGSNDAPVAQDDNANTAEDTPLDIAVLSNDSDVDGDALHVTSVTSISQTHGTVSLNGNGTAHFVPEANYNGGASFDYTISDGNLTATATVHVTITAVNDAPQTQDQTITTAEDMALAFDLGATDVDNTDLTYGIVAAPMHGILVGTAPHLTYTPAANYNGTDSFTFKANDGQLDSNVSTVTITVGGSNDAPVAQADTYAFQWTTPAFTVSTPGVLSNDSDADGDALQAVLAAKPAHGTLVLNADGSFNYTPDAGFNGNDAFTYRASDGMLLSDEVTVIVNVSGNPARTLGLLLSAKTIGEGKSITATVQLSRPSSTDVVVTLDSNNKAVTLPARVVIGAGRTSAAIKVVAVDDKLADGSQLVTLTAHGGAYGTASTTVTAQDNDIAALTLTATPTTLLESGGPVAARGTVTRNGLLSKRLLVRLTCSDVGEARVPAEVVLEVGMASVSFDIAGIDDRIVDGRQSVKLTAHAIGFRDGTASLLVQDNGRVNQDLKLALDGGMTFTERAGGQGVTATLSLSGTVLTRPLSVTLASSETNRISVPKSVVLPAGQSHMTFPVRILDNALADGAHKVWLTARATGYGTASLSVLVQDNDGPTLLLTLAHSSVNEGAATMTGTVEVRNAVNKTGLTVNLACSDVKRATVPAKLTLAAGHTSMSFTVHVLDNKMADGTHRVNLTVSLSGFLSGSATLDILDNETVTYAATAPAMTSGTPSSLRLSTATVSADGRVQLRFSGALNVDTVMDPTLYSVMVNGVAVELESVAYSAGIVTLTLPEGSANAGDVVEVTWHDLSDAEGRNLSGSTGNLIAH